MTVPSPTTADCLCVLVLHRLLLGTRGSLSALSPGHPSSQSGAHDTVRAQWASSKDREAGHPPCTVVRMRPQKPKRAPVLTPPRP